MQSLQCARAVRPGGSKPCGPGGGDISNTKAIRCFQAQREISFHESRQRTCKSPDVPRVCGLPPDPPTHLPSLLQKKKESLSLIYLRRLTLLERYLRRLFQFNLFYSYLSLQLCATSSIVRSTHSSYAANLVISKTW